MVAASSPQRAYVRIRAIPLLASDGSYNFFQRVDYNHKITKGDKTVYRGYIQVCIDDIPEAVKILLELAERRRKVGKGITFKYLLFTEKGPPTDWSKDLTGRYNGLHEADPRIAIYADTSDEILEILEELSADPRWQAFEDLRQASARRPGTHAYKIEETGQFFRSLCYNSAAGHSVYEAKKDWRLHKQGVSTMALAVESEVT